ncbi:MAG: bifunctional phosphoribosyl-AMP cyclohydrolase/phosphoribosyl-ATP diphosphatase HisIE [Pseudomonadota bacterium]
MTLESTINWEKVDGLVPAIIQNASTGFVLMLGYMNQAALRQTEKSGLACFYSRTRQTLWTKGETSGNTLRVESITLDCDGDTLLVRALPTGPTCHTGTTTCFDDDPGPALAFLNELEAVIQERLGSDAANSYTAKLAARGNRYIAQKVGEEAVEVAVAAASNDSDGVVDESADLLYHLLVLLQQHDMTMADVTAKLAERHASASDR